VVGWGNRAWHHSRLQLIWPVLRYDVSGVAAAGTIMTGYAYGKKNKEELRIAGNTVYLIAIGSQVLFAVFFLIFHNQLPKIYTKDEVVISTASSLLLLAAYFS